MADLAINVSAHPEGVMLRIWAMPGARRAGIVGQRNGALKVAVTARPERGSANEAIIDVLCDALRLRRSQMALWSGATRRDKQVLIRGLAVADCMDRLAALLQD
jgi:uncharacterized protein (TIGR00251 family)